MQPEEFRELRENVGITQGAMADAIGMSRSAINAMEAGRAPIELRTELAARWIVEKELQRIKAAVQAGRNESDLMAGQFTLGQLYGFLDKHYVRRDAGL